MSFQRDFGEFSVRFQRPDRGFDQLEEAVDDVERIDEVEDDEQITTQK